MRSTLFALCLAFLLAFAIEFVGCEKLGKLGMFKMNRSSNEIKNDFKVFLTKMQVRRVPLAKKTSELSLTELYKDRRELQELVSNMEQELKNMGKGSSILRKSEILSHIPKDDDLESSSVKAKIKELGANKMNNLQASLDQRRAQLEQVHSEIARAKEIIKNPDAYISIPEHFAENPEEYRDNERQLLIKDRENMLWRQQISNEEIVPTWIEDNW